MNTPHLVPFWKGMPFFRLLLPFIAGIILQWYIRPPVFWMVTGMGCLLCLYIGIRMLPSAKRYRLLFVNGIFLHGILTSAGAICLYLHDIRNHPEWVGNKMDAENTLLMAIVKEPLNEKSKSFKTTAKLIAYSDTIQNKSLQSDIYVYIKKDSSSLLPAIGDTILFNSQLLKPVKHTGNPGSFDYAGYALFQGITHEAFLSAKNYTVRRTAKSFTFRRWLYSLNNGIVQILHDNIKGGKEAGVAEALLVGYRNDLDKNLVQAYANTGVVHVIAISGLHLGLIYGILLLLLKPLNKKKWMKWGKPVLVLSVVWIFALLCGAGASILRAAVMFSCISVGESLHRGTSAYNSLFASAFLLVCYQPFFLWDVGFQLSYAAVGSIFIFMQPVYQLFYFSNKLLDLLWKLSAVSLSAQILTLPLLLFHFHQFPVLFLFTNIVAVPLSSMILISEILLCVLAIIPTIATTAGTITTWLIRCMNGFVEWVNRLRFGTIEEIQVSLLQTLLLYLLILLISLGWIAQKRKVLIPSLLVLALIGLLRMADYYRAARQYKLVVYNIPRCQAIDIISGNRYSFLGEQQLKEDHETQQLYLKAARTKFRVRPANLKDSALQRGALIRIGGKKVLIFDTNTSIPSPHEKTSVDIIILSHNPDITISKLAAAFHCRQYVFDASNSLWKIQQWKTGCDSLHLQSHSVSLQGAFIQDF
jgi:competence protein ComEC